MALSPCPSLSIPWPPSAMSVSEQEDTELGRRAVGQGVGRETGPPSFLPGTGVHAGKGAPGGHLLTNTHLVDLLDPPVDAVEGPAVGDVIHQEDPLQGRHGRREAGGRLGGGVLFQAQCPVWPSPTPFQHTPAPARQPSSGLCGSHTFHVENVWL